ncbi:hypothetical protein BH10PLA1_BH10PLA1_15720 [soil metagenome]
MDQPPLKPAAATPPPLPPVVPYEPMPQDGLPIGVQALLGTLATCPVVFVLVIVVVMTVSNFPSQSTAMWVGASLGLVFLIIALFIAHALRRDERRRGWAIGIYIGLGLSALFWGTCAMILANLSLH